MVVPSSAAASATAAPLRRVLRPSHATLASRVLAPRAIARSSRPNLPILRRSSTAPIPPITLLTRSFTSASSRYAPASGSSITPVDLAYDLTNPSTVKPGTEGQSLVICHGLFGSKQNWRSLAKMFAHQLGMPVYTVDLRNHGNSPHVEPHTYAAMAVDLGHFMAQRGLTSGVNLLGHSMGGKAVMAFALNEELNAPLRTLISVDMTPAKGKISPEFASYAQCMLDIEEAKVTSKSEADKILAKVEPELATRQFLLTNSLLTITPSGSRHLTFRIPVPLLSASIDRIGDFPFTPPSPNTPSSPSSPTWEGPTLFLKGEHSRYINRHNIPVCKAFFPNMRLETLDTGHWVHAEKPKETVGLVEEFVREMK